MTALVELPAYFHDRIAVDDHGCWIWQLIPNNSGYGMAKATDGGHRVMAHRAVYELLIGPIPPLLVLDHVVCRVRICVNPAHVEPVSTRENVLRGARGRSITRCVHGHEYTPENTEWRGPSGRKRRRCRTCKNERRRVRR